MSTTEVIKNIGETLRQRREAQNISIASAAMQTNLSSAVISKLETNRFNEIGAPVFTRGYLVHYVRFLGLNDQAFTLAYNQIAPEQAEIRLSSANVAGQTRSFKRNRIGPWLMALPLLGLAALLAIQVINPDSWLMTQFKQVFSSESTGQTPASGSSNTQEIVLQVEGDDGQTTVPLSVETPPAVEENANLPQLTSLDSLDDPSSETTPTAAAVDIPPANEAQEAPVASESNAGAVLTMTDENWIQIKDKDNKVVASQIFKSGEVVDLPASNAPYSLNIGRPEKVSLSIGGQPAELAQFQKSGSSRNFTLTLTP